LHSIVHWLDEIPRVAPFTYRELCRVIRVAPFTCRELCRVMRVAPGRRHAACLLLSGRSPRRALVWRGVASVHLPFGADMSTLRRIACAAVLAGAGAHVANARPVLDPLSNIQHVEKRAAGWPGATIDPVPQPGDDFATAIEIPSLPALEYGTTCGFRDDVAAPCTFLGGAPDVVYVYTPPADVTVDVDLCQSTYDVALHVYAGPSLDPVDCSDDACGHGARIAGLALQAGVPYFFVIDGWYGACGEYTLGISADPISCPELFPPVSVPEGEPDCHDGVYDSYNRGCNDFPYAFTRLALDDSLLVVRGTYGTYHYYQDEFRDTDWYVVTLPQSVLLQCTAVGGATTVLAIVDGRQGCEAWGITAGPVVADACETAACETEAGPGDYYVVVATRWFSGVRCGTPYVLTLRTRPGPAVAVRSTSWGDLKRVYR
jgi:hypothetical protein